MVGPVTADQGKVVRPSQLIRSVRQTEGRATVLNDKRALATLIAVAVLACAPLAADVVREDSSGLKVHLRVATRGLPVDLQARPLCGIAAGDADSRARAAQFMTRFGRAITEALAEVTVESWFAGWQGELKVVDHAAPASNESGGVRVIKSSAGLDAAIMRALLQAQLPALPNFRARCVFAVTLQEAQPE